MEIPDIFEFHITQYSEIELAEQSFREELKTNSKLKKEYIEWCDELGYSERKGFKSYFINKQESEGIWDSIFPNKEEYEEYEFSL